MVNDSHAGQNLVVIVDDGGLGAVAYERGEHTFTAASEETTTVLTDETGLTWQVTDAALVSDTGDTLARLPGHMAYWFGWFSFYPQTEVYRVEGQ